LSLVKGNLEPPRAIKAGTRYTFLMSPSRSLKPLLEGFFTFV
jgi:hypothetical protein